MLAYYNEIDTGAAAWLRELIYGGYIAPGYVDDRSIEDVTFADVKGFTQCHFFAGIGGWSLALRLAGWSDDKPVWTGSCPCQPFSVAGKGAGFADERHLWPAWFHLVQQCGPAIIFGEQVANSDLWFDLVSSDLEAQGYAIGSAVLGAHSVGAPHIRQRRYFVADHHPRTAYATQPAFHDEEHNAKSRSGARVLEHAARQQVGLSRCSWFDGRPAEWVACRDGKSRPVEPGTFPLAHGVPGRVGLLRGYGNAIVPQAAAAFIKAATS